MAPVPSPFRCCTTNKVFVVRFVRRKGAEPWLAILIPDTTGVAPAARLLLQKIPFIEDVRSFNFPSLTKVGVPWGGVRWGGEGW